ncbi:MAG: PfkB family carbohydrate kinase, partial [Bacillota bacterium]
MSYTVVIGSANVDISLTLDQKIIWRDSNVGSIRLSAGGVGRNIAENLARVGVDTHFIAPLGGEVDASLLRDSCINNGVTLHPITQGTITTSKYAALFDEQKDMLVGVADTLSVEQLDKEAFKPTLELIRNAERLVLETNLSEAMLSYLAPLNDTVYINAISTTKAKRVQSIYKWIDTLSLNRLEAEALTGLEIKEDTLQQVRDFFTEKGVKNIVMTMGGEGAYLMNQKFIEKQAAFTTDVVNTSGAGDAFFAGYIYGIQRKNNPLISASALASLT